MGVVASWRGAADVWEPIGGQRGGRGGRPRPSRWPGGWGVKAQKCLSQDNIHIFDNSGFRM